ncbi:hypothetical protein [Promicromonospora sp. MEB111]|uniref:hypothetical protein n=1 Tax=Promicromonospora sp. MEB111 TaxID=3040301 RepID=UPI00254C9653|nr:hypothetical protein [Promicromonospora sp. MEB111]
MAAVHRDWAWDRPGDVRALPADVDVERRGALVVLRAAMRDLADADRTILVGRHVHGRTTTSIAEQLGLHPHAVPGRLRRAEENLAAALAAAHARHVAEPECRAGRAVMHDYLAGHLLPHSQRRLEVHMNDCARCTRAFVDVCDVSWALREAGSDAVVEGAPADVTARPAHIGTRVNRRETAVAAAALVAVTVIGASTYVADQTGEPAGQVLESAGVDEGVLGVGDPGNREAPPPPSIRPANRHPRPSTMAKYDAAATVQTVAAARTTQAAATEADTGLTAADQGADASSRSESAAGTSSGASALDQGVEHANAAATQGLTVAVAAAAAVSGASAGSSNGESRRATATTGTPASADS